MTYEEELAEIEKEAPEPTGGGDDAEDGEGTPAGDTEEQKEEQEKKADAGKKQDRRTGKKD